MLRLNFLSGKTPLHEQIFMKTSFEMHLAGLSSGLVFDVFRMETGTTQ